MGNCMGELVVTVIWLGDCGGSGRGWMGIGLFEFVGGESGFLVGEVHFFGSSAAGKSGSFTISM